jgi:hypothetical protein
MNEHINFSTIEQLPNELFFNIFQYINAYDLHRGWSKLNKRFRSILYSVPMYAHLIEKNDYKNYKSCFRYYASQFISIRIEENCNIPETFDISHFSNIRSLHLSIVMCKQYDQIIPDNMPYLTHLTINTLHAQRNPASLLFGSKQFINLKTCQLPYIFSTNDHLQPCLTLRSLHLNFCSTEVFFEQVKVLLPNLVYFESVFGTNSTRTDFIRDKQHMMTPHNILRHVKIELRRNTTVSFLPLLLTVLPEIRCLELFCPYYCDYRQVAELLQTKVPRLKQFNFSANESQYQSLPDIEILKQMSPWFTQMKLEQYGDNKRIICNMKK